MKNFKEEEDKALEMSSVIGRIKISTTFPLRQRIVTTDKLLSAETETGSVQE